MQTKAEEARAENMASLIDKKIQEKAEVMREDRKYEKRQKIQEKTEGTREDRRYERRQEI